MSDALMRMQTQIESNRVGIVTINKLMTNAEWITVMAKVHQFMFGLSAWLAHNFPDMLDLTVKLLFKRKSQSVDVVVEWI